MLRLRDGPNFAKMVVVLDVKLRNTHSLKNLMGVFLNAYYRNSTKTFSKVITAFKNAEKTIFFPCIDIFKGEARDNKRFLVVGWDHRRLPD